jgi:PIN domain nuclease of toxin-antitoxin system
VTIRIVADTHALLWYLYNDPRLSNSASSLMDEIEQATALHLGVPLISRDRKIRSSIVTTIW